MIWFVVDEILVVSVSEEARLNGVLGIYVVVVSETLGVVVTASLVSGTFEVSPTELVVKIVVPDL